MSCSSRGCSSCRYLQSFNHSWRLSSSWNSLMQLWWFYDLNPETTTSNRISRMFRMRKGWLSMCREWSKKRVRVRGTYLHGRNGREESIDCRGRWPHISHSCSISMRPRGHSPVALYVEVQQKIIDVSPNRINFGHRRCRQRIHVFSLLRQNRSQRVENQMGMSFRKLQACSDGSGGHASPAAVRKNSQVHRGVVTTRSGGGGGGGGLAIVDAATAAVVAVVVQWPSGDRRSLLEKLITERS